MDAASIWKEISLAPAVITLLEGKLPAVEAHRELIDGLTCPETAQAAAEALSAALGDNDMAVLACQLEAGALYYDRYLQKGVSSRILVDTLKCFSRFLGETFTMTGQWKFDRDWWTWRQVSGLLFRIEELEYEMLPETGEISLHIPSDAVFTPENVDTSLAAAKAFFAEFFPGYANAGYVCHSWLLSPKLKELLPPNSNIRSFQNRFAITHVEPDNRDFIGWLFRVSGNTAVGDLPENTSLQKKTKQLLLAGGNIGEAGGILL